MRRWALLAALVAGVGLSLVGCETLAGVGDWLAEPAGGSVPPADGGEPGAAADPTSRGDTILSAGAGVATLLGLNPLVVMPVVQAGHWLMGLLRRKRSAPPVSPSP